MDMEVRLRRWVRVGKEVAEYASRHFATELQQSQDYIAGNYKDALVHTFLLIDTLLRSEPGKKELAEITKEFNASSSKQPSMFAEEEGEGADMKGCTANVILVKGNTLYVANAGDSRSVAILSGGKAQELSKDHKPDNEIELQRITKAGGNVFNGRVQGNLNLSRALGDLQYKSNKDIKPEEQMICAYPDVVIREITPDLEYIIMGCDGVYDAKSSQEIADLVLKKIATATNLSSVAESLLDDLLSPNCALTNGAGCDNMTCLLIKLKH